MKKWRIINTTLCKAQFQFEPRDLWIGAFWRTKHAVKNPCYTLHIYLCLIPLVPLHITWLLRKKSVEADAEKFIAEIDEKESIDAGDFAGPRLTCAACGKITDSMKPFCEDCP